MPDRKSIRDPRRLENPHFLKGYRRRKTFAAVGSGNPGESSSFDLDYPTNVPNFADRTFPVAASADSLSAASSFQPYGPGNRLIAKRD